MSWGSSSVWQGVTQGSVGRCDFLATPHPHPRPPSPCYRPTMPDLWTALHAAIDAHEPDRLDAGDHPAAAVLVPVLPYPEPHIVFTVRSQLVEHHKGEISFPGGIWEPDDEDLRRTALREAWEETGIDPGHVRILGEVSHFVTISNFHVTPYVGLLDRAPYPFRASAVEVAEIPRGAARPPARPGQPRRAPH